MFTQEQLADDKESALALAKKGTVTDTTKFSGNVGKYEARGSVESTYTTTDAPPDPTPDPTPDPDVEEGPRVGRWWWRERWLLGVRSP